MADLSEIFGDTKLSYDEFLVKVGEFGAEIGDTRELRQCYEEELREIRRSSALERELDRAGARNRGIISKVIDMNAVTVDEDGVHGIREQLDALRASDPYLFDTAQSSPTQPRTLRTGMPHGHEPLDSDSLSDADYYKNVKKL